MKAIAIKENVYWVGGIDWRLRNFHGYMTQRGSTYNAYLIIDEKITLIDSVKHYLHDEMYERISSIVDPKKIDVIICNHVEMDHSGAIPKIFEIAENAQIYASPKGVEGLGFHYPNMEVSAVKTGDSISIGSRSLSFVQTPMVHWPDNMVTYCPEDRILFSNDAFGQHIASSQRFDDEYPVEIILEEAKKYYANIVLPYGNQVKKALNNLAGLDIEVIAPSHGLLWRKNIAKIVQEYGHWANNDTEQNAIIVYDTMWESTAKIAYALCEACDRKGIHAELYCLQDTHISDIMTQIMTARYIFVGSSTLNSQILPTVAAFLTYLKGLSPKNRTGLAFGSYGWGGQSIPIIDQQLQECKFDMLESVKIKYIPTPQQLEEIASKVAQELG
jgi:flavorubredoxin